METDSTQGVPAALQASLGDRYLIEGELGRGGMATVYRARDPRHDRPVAVKVLHEELAAVLGAQRFLTEIRTTAALQHPHILPLFDSGSVGGLLYYVMPYVVGETLRTRLARERQLPVADAVRIATEVATALEYAHRHGVIHRDIKPENILLGEGGGALVADFGIALAVTHAAGERITQSGLSIGTPQYMAPEQAAAERAIDARADVYALGVVTYEMLAGMPPFAAPTSQGVIARLMTEEPPPLTRHRRNVPSNVEAAVLRALEKLPADRFPTAIAFADALTASPTAEPVRVPAPRGIPRSQRMAPLLAVGAVAAAAIGWWAGRRPPAPPKPFPIRIPIDLDSGSLAFGEPAISPDGRAVAFVVERPDSMRLGVRHVDDITTRTVDGTENASLPFFSPDGEWVAFYSNGAIRKVRVNGGAPILVTLLPAGATFGGGAWGESETIYFAQEPAGALFRVPAAGGHPTRVPVADSLIRIQSPHLLPGNRHLLVTAVQNTSFNAARVGILDLATGRLRQFAAGFGAHYASGWLVYTTQRGELYRQRMDLERLEPIGDPEQIESELPGVQGQCCGYGFDVSASGALVYQIGRRRSDYTHGKLSVTDSSGRALLAIPARVPWMPRFSPDGRRLVYGAYAPGRDSSDIWVISDLQTGGTERFTSDGNDNNDPVWSGDGTRIAYSSLATGGKDVFVKTLDGGPPKPLVKRPGNQWATDWARDGRALLFSEGTSTGDLDIWVQPVLGGEPAGQPRPYLASPARELGARFSPDGQWVAYQSDETGRWEVYVQSYPASGRKTLVSSEGGVDPVWSRDGQTLYYWRADRLIAARVEGAGAARPLVVRSRTARFGAPYMVHGSAMYDVSPDGRRFAIVTSDAGPGRLIVAFNTLSADKSSSDRRR